MKENKSSEHFRACDNVAKVLWLNEAQVRSLLPIPVLIDLMESTLAAFSGGATDQPLRTVIGVEPGASFFASMPAHLPALKVLGAKLVTVFGKNPELGLPSHLATILLMSAETGAALAILDGRYITEARTAAVSAVAARYLAPKTAPVLAILGSGVQASSHFEALTASFDFQEVRAWSPNPARLARFVEASHGARAAETAEDAVRNAGVVVLATSSPEPVLRREWVTAGACVLSVGACRPNQREMDPELVAQARVVVDSRISALRESGDIMLGIQEGRFEAGHILAELGELVSAPVEIRRDPSEIVVFKSLGLAVEDIACAHLVYRRALERGAGVKLA